MARRIGGQGRGSCAGHLPPAMGGAGRWHRIAEENQHHRAAAFGRQGKAARGCKVDPGKTLSQFQDHCAQTAMANAVDRSLQQIRPVAEPGKDEAVGIDTHIDQSGREWMVLLRRAGVGAQPHHRITAAGTFDQQQAESRRRCAVLCRCSIEFMHAIAAQTAMQPAIHMRNAKAQHPAGNRQGCRFQGTDRSSRIEHDVPIMFHIRQYASHGLRAARLWRSTANIFEERFAAAAGTGAYDVRRIACACAL